MIIKCKNCGRDLSDDSNAEKKLPCPDCGSSPRHYYLSVAFKGIGIIPSVVSEVRDTSGFLLIEEKFRQINSSGRRIRHINVINRTDPELTLKYSKLEELDEHGIVYRKLFENRQPSPAKHRPRKMENDEN